MPSVPSRSRPSRPASARNAPSSMRVVESVRRWPSGFPDDSTTGRGERIRPAQPSPRSTAGTIGGNGSRMGVVVVAVDPDVRAARCESWIGGARLGELAPLRRERLGLDVFAAADVVARHAPGAYRGERGDRVTEGLEQAPEAGRRDERQRTRGPRPRDGVPSMVVTTRPPAARRAHDVAGDERVAVRRGSASVRLRPGGCARDPPHR